MGPAAVCLLLNCSCANRTSTAVSQGQELAKYEPLTWKIAEHIVDYARDFKNPTHNYFKTWLAPFCHRLPLAALHLSHRLE
jgi:hypothetical protein